MVPGTSTQSPGGLCGLLNGHSVDDFFEQVWERLPLLAAGAAQQHAREILTVEQFESLLASSASSVPSSLSVIEGGRACPVGTSTGAIVHLPPIYNAYAAGSTLLQSRLQATWPPIARLCRSLDLELLSRGLPLAEPVGANAYLTPAGARGLGIHYDDHCAFIVQVHGRKRWQVFRPLEELPLERCTQSIPAEQAGDPLLTEELAPGDVLYIPRGFPHVAETAGQSSLHVTLSLRTITWSDAVAGIVRRSPRLRRSLTPGGTETASVGADVQGDLLPELVEADVDGFRRRRLVDCLASLEPLPQGRFDAIDQCRTLSVHTLVRRLPGMLCVATQEDGEAVLRFPGATLRLPGVMAPVFDFIATRHEFSPQDLPSIAATYDPLELTRILVQQGLVRLTGTVDQRTDETLAEALRPGDGALREVPAKRPRGLAGLTLLHGQAPSKPFHLDWMYCAERLSDADCDEIIAASLEFPLAAPTTVGEERYPGHREAYARRIGVSDRTQWMFDLLCGVATEATKTGYGLTLTGITRAPQYVEYHPGFGHFLRHNDYSHDQADSPRKITVIIQLSSPEEYEGGRLQAFGVDVEELPRERGSVLVLPSFLYHAVTPVTAGVRRALVSWIAGPRLC